MPTRAGTHDASFHTDDHEEEEEELEQDRQPAADGPSDVMMLMLEQMQRQQTIMEELMRENAAARAMTSRPNGGTSSSSSAAPTTAAAASPSIPYEDRVRAEAVKELPKLVFNRKDRATVLEEWVQTVSSVIGPYGDAGQEFWTLINVHVRALHSTYLDADEEEIERLVVADFESEGQLRKVELALRPMLQISIPADLVALARDKKRLTVTGLLYEIYISAGPGSPQDRDQVVRAMDNVRVAENANEALTYLRQLERTESRADDLRIPLPDVSVKAKVLIGLTSKIEDHDADFRMRVSLRRLKLNLNRRPKNDNLLLYRSFLYVELRALAAVFVNKKDQNQLPLGKAAQVDDRGGKGGKGKGKGDRKGGKGDGKGDGERVCRFFQSPDGCRAGQSCTFPHNRLSPSSGCCFNCGSSSHQSKECDRPRKGQGDNKDQKVRTPKAKKSNASEQSPSTPRHQQQQQQQQSPQQQQPPASPQQAEPSPEPKSADIEVMKAAMLRVIAEARQFASSKKVIVSEEVREVVTEEVGEVDGPPDLVDTDSEDEDFLQWFDQNVVSPPVAVVAASAKVDDDEELVMVDSGSSHVVIPENDSLSGTILRPVALELAAGSCSAEMNEHQEVVIAYSPNGDPVKCLLPLGRFIRELDLTVSWTSKSMTIRGDGVSIRCKIISDIPHISKDQFDTLRRRIREKELLRAFFAEVIDQPSSAAVRDVEHVRCGHQPYDGSCEVCVSTSGRSRPHRRVQQTTTGVLSVDLSGPHPMSPAGERYALVGVFVRDDRDIRQGPLAEDVAVDPPGLGGLAAAPPPRHRIDRKMSPEDAQAMGYRVEAGEVPRQRLNKKTSPEEAAQMGYLLDLFELAPPPAGLVDDGADDVDNVVVLPYIKGLKTKEAEEVKTAIMEMINQLTAGSSSEPPVLVRRLHSDRGGEFINKSLQEWLVQRGVHQTTSTDKQSNGRCERYVGIAKETARRVLDEARLEPRFWLPAMKHSTMIYRKQKLGQKLPRWMPKIGDRVVLQLNSPESRKTWGRRSHTGRFLGMENDSLHQAVVLRDDNVIVKGTTIRGVDEDGVVDKDYMEFLKENDVVVKLDPEGVAFYETKDGAVSRTPPLAFIPKEVAQPPVQPAEVDPEPDQKDEEYGCPACKGRHVPHRRDSSCRLDGQPLPGSASGCPACRGIHTAHTRLPGCRLYPTAAMLNVKQGDTDSGATSLHYTAKDIMATVGEDLKTWTEAARKEFLSLTDESQALVAITTQEEKDLMAAGGEFIPMMEVWTQKAMDEDGKRKKKCRGVLLGQLSGQRPAHVNTAAADANAMRIVTSLTGGFQLEQGHIDIKTAFLNAKLPDTLKPITTRLGKGMGRLLNLQDQAYRVDGAQYGLTISPRCWGIKRDGGLRKITWKIGKKTFVLEQSDLDESLWSVTCEGEALDEFGRPYGVLATYVDDFLCGFQPGHFQCFLQALTDQCGWTVGSSQLIKPMPSGADASELLLFKGHELQYKGHDLHVRQSRYVAEILDKYGLADANPIQWPTVESEWSDETPTAAEIHAAQEVTGCLVWLSSNSRPDVAEPVRNLSERLTTHPVQVVKKAKKVLRYLRGTADVGLVYPEFDASCFGVAENDEAIKDFIERRGEVPSSSGGVPDDQDHRAKNEKFLIIHAYADASFSPEGERSVSGVAIRFGRGSPIGWLSRRQSMTAQSTAESELLSTCTGVQIAQSFQAVLASMGFRSVIQGYQDNKAAIATIAGRGAWRSRHYSLRASALRDQILAGTLAIIYVQSLQQVADIFTKGLSRLAFQDAFELLRLGRDQRVVAVAKSIAVVAKAVRADARFANAAVYMAGELFERATRSVLECHCPQQEECHCPQQEECQVWPYVAGGAVAGGATVHALHRLYSFLFGPVPPNVQSRGNQAMDTYANGRFRFLGSKADNYATAEDVKKKKDKTYRMYRCCRRMHLDFSRDD